MLSRRFSSAALAACVLVCPLATSAAVSDVSVVHVDAEIDGVMVHRIDTAIRAANTEKASAVILVIDTPGGYVWAAEEIRATLLASDVPTVALVQGGAYSAGSLIALSCHRIYMTPGSVMGASTPVYGDGSAAPKHISAMAKTFAATAEARGRRGDVARAMVDPAVVIEGVTERGSIVTLTAKEAQAVGYTDGIVGDLAGVVSAEQLEGGVLRHHTTSLGARLLSASMSTGGAIFLLTIGLLGFIVDLKVGGSGAGSFASLAALGAFFWAQISLGSATPVAITLAAVGAILLLLEVFVVPGTGVTGAAGIIVLFIGLFMTLLGDFEWVTMNDLLRAGAVLGGTIFFAGMGLMAIIRWLPGRRDSLGGLILQSAVSEDS